LAWHIALIVQENTYLLKAKFNVATTHHLWGEHPTGYLMQTFKTVKEVHQHILDQGWKQANGKQPSFEAIRKAINAKHIIRDLKSGVFHAKEVDSYCAAKFTNTTDIAASLSLAEQIKYETVRAKRFKTDCEMGKYILLSEEEKRRVAVFQGMKTAMVNGKAAFMRQLQAGAKEQRLEIHDELFAIIAEGYVDAVLTVFDDIGKRGTV